MPLRKRKPTSPGRRFQTVSDFAEITKKEPERSLLAPKPSTGGRNSYGRKTARHKGGRHKQRYRIVDFKRTKDGVPAKVAAVEYDPNRNCRILLLHYLDGEKRYIIAPRRAEVGNAEAELIKIGKAGRNRWKGVRPQTRGVAMNPVDHPLGGGEGKSSGGRHPVSPWGKPEGRTRNKNKESQKLIVRRRRTRGSRR